MLPCTESPEDGSLSGPRTSIWKASSAALSFFRRQVMA
jgi:hypothetical protein